MSGNTCIVCQSTRRNEPLLNFYRIPRAAKVWGVRCWRSGGQKLEIGGQMLEVEYKVLDLN